MTSPLAAVAHSPELLGQAAGGEQLAQLEQGGVGGQGEEASRARRRRRASSEASIPASTSIRSSGQPAYFSRSAISGARVPAQVTRRTEPVEQLEVRVPDPGDVAAVGDPVVERDPEVEALARRPRAAACAGPRWRPAGFLIRRIETGVPSTSIVSTRPKAARTSASAAAAARRRPRARRRRRAPRARCRRCRGRGGGARAASSPRRAVRTVDGRAAPSRAARSRSRRGRARAARRRSSGTSSGRGGRRRRARRCRDGRSGGSAWRRRRAGARAAPGRGRRSRSRRRPRGGCCSASRPRSAISGSSALRTKRVRPARAGDQRRPLVGEGLDLAVAVELVAEEVAEHDQRRGRARAATCGSQASSTSKRPSLAALLEQRRRDAPGHVRAGPVVDRVAAVGGEDRGDHPRGRRLAVGRADDRHAAVEAGAEAGDRVRGEAQQDPAGQGRAAAAAAGPAGGADRPREPPAWLRTGPRSGARAQAPDRRGHDHAERLRQHPQRGGQVGEVLAVGVDRVGAAGAQLEVPGPEDAHLRPPRRGCP